MATWYQELTHWKRPWCWERMKAGGEGGERGWDGWMASLTRWTWVWASSRSWWWTGKPGMLQSMGSQRVGYDWTTELNWWQSLGLSIILGFLKWKLPLFDKETTYFLWKVFLKQQSSVFQGFCHISGPLWEYWASNPSLRGSDPLCFVCHGAD